MSLIYVLIVVIIIAILWGVLERVAPMSPMARMLIGAAIAIAVLLWILQILGFHTGVHL